MSTVQEAPPTGITAGTPGRAEIRPFSFDAATFGRMLDAEVFNDEVRVELWDGQVYEKMAKTQAHAVAGINATMTLARVLPPGWCLSPENPVALGPKSTPLPDFAVLRGRGNDYVARRPAPVDVGLLIALSATSLRADTGTRLAGYAAAGIAVYWVVNVIENVVLVFERPVPAEGRYESSATYAVGQSVPFRLDGVPVAEIPAADLLPVRRGGVVDQPPGDET